MGLNPEKGCAFVIYLFLKNRPPRIVIPFNYSLHKKVPVLIQNTHRITEKDSLKHIQFKFKKVQETVSHSRLNRDI